VLRTPKQRKQVRIPELTPDAIRTAARNIDDIYEIAELLDVSIGFLRDEIGNFQAKGIWSSFT